jgi:hypothetical protein
MMPYVEIIQPMTNIASIVPHRSPFTKPVVIVTVLKYHNPTTIGAIAIATAAIDPTKTRKENTDIPALWSIG